MKVSTPRGVIYYDFLMKLGRWNQPQRGTWVLVAGLVAVVTISIIGQSLMTEAARRTQIAALRNNAATPTNEAEPNDSAVSTDPTLDPVESAPAADPEIQTSSPSAAPETPLATPKSATPIKAPVIPAPVCPTGNVVATFIGMNAELGTASNFGDPAWDQMRLNGSVEISNRATFAVQGVAHVVVYANPSRSVDPVHFFGDSSVLQPGQTVTIRNSSYGALRHDYDAVSSWAIHDVVGQYYYQDMDYRCASASSTLLIAG